MPSAVYKRRKTSDDSYSIIAPRLVIDNWNVTSSWDVMPKLLSTSEYSHFLKNQSTDSVMKEVVLRKKLPIYKDLFKYMLSFHPVVSQESRRLLFGELIFFTCTRLQSIGVEEYKEYYDAIHESKWEWNNWVTFCKHQHSDVFRIAFKTDVSLKKEF